MKKDNLQNKLFESGLIEEGNVDKINAFKQEHKKQYLKDYNKEYNNKKHRKLINFTPEELGYLKEQAKNHQYQQLSPFLKDVMFAYLKGTYIFPDHKSYNEVLESIRTTKNYVLESIKYIHLNEAVTYDDIQQLITRIDHLEISIDRILSSPPKLKTWIENQRQKDSKFIPKLLQTVSELIL